MKVLGISGSPKRRGNVEALLDKALEGAESEGAKGSKIILNELNFKPCQECGGCRETGRCVIADDMQEVYRKIFSSDAVIVASPIFFGSITTQLKGMIDRFQCAWVAKYLLKKASAPKKKVKGAFLAVGGSDKKEFFENARGVIRIFFATADIVYSKELFYGGIEDKGEITKNEKAMEEVYNIGRDLT